MKKQLIHRGRSGFFYGITIGFLIALIISILIGDGTFYPVTMELIDTMGTELNAVILQTVFCGIIGAGFSMASVIWEMDSWSLAKQNGVYFSIVCAIMFPIAYFANWMGHSLLGILVYIGLFILIFLIIWVVKYLLWKNKISKMNDMVKKTNHIE